MPASSKFVKPLIFLSPSPLRSSSSVLWLQIQLRRWRPLLSHQLLVAYSRLSLRLSDTSSHQWPLWHQPLHRLGSVLRGVTCILTNLFASTVVASFTDQDTSALSASFKFVKPLISVVAQRPSRSSSSALWHQI